MNRYVGTMDESMLSRYVVSSAQRESMDEQIRKRFKIPDNRYFTVTLSPSPPGMVFVDEHRNRSTTTPKLSKSS